MPGEIMAYTFPIPGLVAFLKDAFGQAWPEPSVFIGVAITALALLNLRDVWKNCAAEGSRNLIIPRVIETQSELDRIQHAVPGSNPTVCQLRASNETLIARVRNRELGAGRAWHEARALELAQSLQRNAPADFLVETDNRSPVDIAEDVFRRVDWVTGAATARLE